MKIKRLTITVTNDNEFLPTIECGDGSGIYPMEIFKSFKDAVEFVKGIDPEFVGKIGETKKTALTEEQKQKLREGIEYLGKAIEALKEDEE